ncbi:MAG TPA: hypothetical protein VFL45_03585 [Gammaproteobacteria bacterium]|nr:hypothetical protein [Gammaproteobacteria bacterium]
MDSFIATLFRLSENIRYVAVYRSGSLELQQRPGLRDASAAESNRYEEFLVNPTLLTLARQRGEIDCGDLEFLLIRYGHFFLLAHPFVGGHFSVGIEVAADPLALVEDVRAAAMAHGLLASAT